MSHRGEEQEKNLYVWISGQSNAAGRVNVSGLTGGNAYLADLITIGEHSAYIMDYASTPDDFEIIEAGVNTGDGTNQFGCQPKLGYDLINALGRDVFLMQCAEGGKAISNWNDGGDYMEYIKAKTDAVKLSDPLALFKYFVWIQGESDGGGAGYDAKLRNLIARMRRDISPNLIFIIVQMIDCQSGVSSLAGLQSQQASVSAESSKNFLVAKGSPYDGCQDSLHFNLSKQLDISDKVRDIILSTL